MKNTIENINNADSPEHAQIHCRSFRDSRKKIDEMVKNLEIFCGQGLPDDWVKWDGNNTWIKVAELMAEIAWKSAVLYLKHSSGETGVSFAVSDDKRKNC